MKGELEHRVPGRRLLKGPDGTDMTEAHYGPSCLPRHHVRLDATVGYLFEDGRPRNRHGLAVALSHDASFGDAGDGGLTSRCSGSTAFMSRASMP